MKTNRQNVLNEVCMGTLSLSAGSGARFWKNFHVLRDELKIMLLATHFRSILNVVT